MPLFDSQRQHNTRNQRLFDLTKHSSVKFSNSFFPDIQKKYESLPKSWRSKSDKDLFKQEGKVTCVQNKFLSKGSKVGCKFITQRRVGRSSQNSHSFTVGKTPSPECMCHFPHESPTHVFLECFIYNEERRILMSISSKKK